MSPALLKQSTPDTQSLTDLDTTRDPEDRVSDNCINRFVHWNLTDQDLIYQEYLLIQTHF